MTVYSGPVFDMAANQFNVIANHLDIPTDERERLLMPKRAITVSCPIHRDDGSVSVFEGYRVQHLLTMGPTKGGTRFRSRAPADAEAGDHGVLSDPSRRRLGLRIRGLPRAASAHNGANQRRHAICSLGRYRRGGGAGDLDELEMRAGRSALWRRQGRGECRSLHHIEA